MHPLLFCMRFSQFLLLCCCTFLVACGADTPEPEPPVEAQPIAEEEVAPVQEAEEAKEAEEASAPGLEGGEAPAAEVPTEELPEPVEPEEPAVEPPAEETPPEPEPTPEPTPEPEAPKPAAEEAPVADAMEQEAQDLMKITEAAMLGDTEAQFTLGKLLKEDASTAEIRTMGWAWLSVAADEGHPNAGQILSELAPLLDSDELAMAAQTKQQLQQTIVTPSEQEQIEDRDAQRAIDITKILEAMTSYIAEHGSVPESIPIDSAWEICLPGKDCTDRVSIQFLVDAGLLSSVPVDPTADPAKNGTRYMLRVNSDMSVTVAALNTETSVVPLTVTQ